MKTTTPTWAAAPDAPTTMARYCAPTVLAALMGVPRLEAAELLLSIPGMAYPTKGGVWTHRWRGFLRHDLGGKDVNPVDLSNAATGKHPEPTVAMFCRAFPTGTYVLGVNGHTLLVRDGEVLADTQPTNSMRARVQAAIQMPCRAEGLPAGEQVELDRAEQAHKERLARRRRNRERQERIRREQRIPSLEQLFRF